MAVVPWVNLVLMGRAGNGKSATGNTILGKKAFDSRKSSSGITKTSQLQTCVRKDGQVVNVIDTPGMFDLSDGAEYIAREIVKCSTFARGEIHAVLFVFSLRTQFTQEEEATIQTLQNLFGPKIVDYAIVVLTGSDEFDDNDINSDNNDSLADYLSNECAMALKDILAACKNRCVVFDNKTKSESKKDEQVNKLLDLVNGMIAKNGGKPYKPGFISNLKLEKEFDEVKSKFDQSCTQYLYKDPKLGEKLNEMTPEIKKFQRKLEEEREASRRVEERSHEMQKQYSKLEKKNEDLCNIPLERSLGRSAVVNPRPLSEARSSVVNPRPLSEARSAVVNPCVNLVLMGRTGNGKSATGNTILGTKAFESRKSSSGITKTSRLETCVRKDGQVVNVIDTPGMFNLSDGAECIAREIVKCITFARGEIHAVLLVFSLRTRFTKEEEATIQTLQNSFGPKIVDYAIVLLTGGDEFDDDINSDNDDLLEDYLSNKSSVALKDILAACKNRCVVFDNKTKSELKKDEQVNKLLDLVNEMIAKNGEQPYKPGFKISNHKLEKEFDEVKRKLDQSCTQDLYKDPKLEEKMNEMMPEIKEFQRKLEEEREASRKAEERSHEMQKQYRELEKQNEELRNIALQRSAVVNPCPLSQARSIMVNYGNTPYRQWCSIL